MLTDNCCQYYREKLGLKQHEVAAAMRTYQGAVSRIEADPYSRSLRQLQAYARALGFPLVVLLPILAHVPTPCREERRVCH